ncbi:hypothetical protein ACJJH9_12225 [Microbulbifer sp. DLAB2-AF]|uniref:hypothetical protein n=1 Tax=Microbulbifer sp. DLAB2-AF TaxID=3243395 RepID=UPI00403A1F6B
MGNLIFGKTTIQGHKFDNIKLQTSKAGVPRQIIFGRVKPVIGNIIATTPPKIVKKKQKQKSGKGGGKTEVVTEEVYRTYAIRICEGPITGICKVWRNNELVYDRDSTDPTQIDNNQAFLQLAEFFLGGFQQMPSAVLQAAFGINNVPAHRGTCYLVIDNENLTSTGGAIPQYAFEVERSEGFVLTSPPYAIEVTEALTGSARAGGARLMPDDSYSHRRSHDGGAGADHGRVARPPPKPMTTTRRKDCRPTQRLLSVKYTQCLPVTASPRRGCKPRRCFPVV